MKTYTIFREKNGKLYAVTPKKFNSIESVEDYIGNMKDNKGVFYR